MKNILLSLFLFFGLYGISEAAVPSRPYTYVAHTTIDPAQNNTNENTLYSYLQAGVDTYSSGSITNDAISAIAAISYSKLNLLGSIVNADVSPTAGIVGSKLDLTSPGAIGSTSANTGAFSTLKVGTTHQGDILYDNGTSLVRLTPGTDGQFLKTQGSSANPIWSTVTIPITFSQLFTSSGTFTAPVGITKVYLTMSAGGGGGGGAGSNSNSHAGGGASGQYVINYPYTVVAGNSYTVTIGALGAGGDATPSNGSNGGNTSFDALTLTGGNGGALASSSNGAGGTALTPASTRIGGILGFSNPGQAGSTSGGGGGGFTLFGVGGNGGVTAGDGGTPTSTAAAVNTGAGGGGAVGIGGGNVAGSNGGSGICFVQY